MKKSIAGFGILLLILAALLFLIVFSAGALGPFLLIGTNSTANFLAFLFVIIALPVGSGLAFFGLSYRAPVFAAGTPEQVLYKSDGRGLAIAALVIAILFGGAALAVSISNYNSNSQQSTNYSNLNSQLSSLSSKIESLNETPGVVAVKMQWCLQNVVQDRFCPGNIVVAQGDIVQIFFLQNDTAVHTFNLGPSGPYDFQINDSGQGELDFLNNYAPLPGNCSNSGTFAQISTGISGVYCVSGTSLLPNSTLVAHGANIFYIAQNPNPGLPFTPGNQIVSGEPPGVNLTNPGPVFVPVNDQAVMVAMNVSGVGVSAVCGAVCETQGIGAFWATVPGVYEFYCHYHVSNGMFGYFVVLPNAYCKTYPTSCGLNSTSAA